jgi:hypothetical protein
MSWYSIQWDLPTVYKSHNFRILSGNRPESLIHQYGVGGGMFSLHIQNRQINVEDLRFSQQWLWRLVFWVVTSCCSQRAWPLRGTYRLHVRGWKVNQARNRRNGQPTELVPLKCWTVSELHIVTTQKTECSVKLMVWCVYVYSAVTNPVAELVVLTVKTNNFVYLGIQLYICSKIRLSRLDYYESGPCKWKWLILKICFRKKLACNSWSRFRNRKCIYKLRTWFE